MPEYRVTITHWLDDETKSKLKDAGLGLAEKSGDEEDLTATAYTEILIGAPDEETANRTVNDLIGSHQGDQVWDVEEV